MWFSPKPPNPHVSNSPNLSANLHIRIAMPKNTVLR